MTGIKRCPKCEKEIPVYSNFCLFCGSKIKNCTIKSVVQKENEEEYEKEKQRYSDEIRELADNYNTLKNEEIKLIKKKKSLRLKVDNYRKLLEGEFPNCEKNKDAPDMAVVENDERKIWRIMIIISLEGIISALIPWATIYFENSMRGMSLSCVRVLLLAIRDSWLENGNGAVNNRLYFVGWCFDIELVYSGTEHLFSVGSYTEEKRGSNL